MKGSDEAQRAEAFATHGAELYHLALVVLRNVEDARGAMQTTFERAWQHRARYDDTRPRRSWLLAIAGHQAISLARRRRVRAAVALHDQHHAAEPPGEVNVVLW